VRVKDYIMGEIDELVIKKWLWGCYFTRQLLP